MTHILPRSFYARGPETVAKELLGKIFVRRVGGRMLTGVIVETEAYLAAGDEAAHNFKGRTKRNESLYREAGHAYIHSMRQYCLLDIVTEAANVPSSVLIRAVEPLLGVDYMKQKRGTDSVEALASGPGKFCISFAIGREFDGIDLAAPEAPFSILDSENGEVVIETSGRIGISTAKDALLRFWIKGSRFVSRNG